MYTEEFEGFEEEEKGPRTYVSNMSNFSQQDAERLARENEKLKKNLEKEKFFNKLLDQEIKELKSEASSRYPSDYPSSSGVSKGAFYTLCFLALAMAGFIFYTLYNNKQYNLFDSNAVSTPQADPSPAGEQTQDFSTFPDEAASNNNTASATPPPAVKDSVPNIIGNNKNVSAAAKNSEVNKQAAAAPKEEEYNEAEVEAALREPVNTTPKKPAASAAQKQTTPPATAATTEESAQQQAPPATQEPTRPVIGRYRVSSKANFYNGPDENTLRSAFISAGANKFVDALDDKNGFIYVEYVNDHGMLSKGWLSKADLTKAD